MVFSDGYEALKGINLYIEQNEFLTLLGPSGCGKTTTLRIVGGFEKPTLGDVLYRGKSIVDLPPYRRNINTVFQRYALFPHMNVAQNVSFGPDMRKEDRKETARQVAKMLELVNLSGFEKRPVSSLSGGQQQRVAIARALINKPDVLLLDEPLGALDLKLRKEMQGELKRIQVESGITFLYVTHDQEEALTMSDTVVVMRGGEIQQVGTPQDIYNEPKNAFVADFIGESNIYAGTMVADRRAIFLGSEFPCVDTGFGQNAPVDVVLRPEDVKLKPAQAQMSGVPRGKVLSTLFKGVHYEMSVQVGEDTVLVHSTHAREPGAEVLITVAPSDIHIMHKDARAHREEKDEQL
ncbi:MAG: ABC transporter ATP-binding protein [Clostridia bacterium]|nr:ABC transporter ATP-binding protein [Clostridia bacterium]